MSLADAARTPHTSTADALLTVRGLHKRFGDNEVLRGIDLTLHRGEVVVLIGPSGSGKTTVLRAQRPRDARCRHDRRRRRARYRLRP